MTSAGFPSGKRFAFAIIDDTDVATVANVKPVYDLLHQLQMRATKTVWPVGCPEGGGDYEGSQTLEDPEYLAFVRELHERGFEITWHGATMQSSRRERTLHALARFNEALGFFPRIHVNHSRNAENIYWGADRLDDPVLRFLLKRFNTNTSAGSRPESEYWWGDHCSRHVTYARNLTFKHLDVHRINPTMPYRDPRRPLVSWWFSTADADNADEFSELLCTENQERLQRSGGYCIVSTHFGKDFVRNGCVDPRVRARLEEMAQRPGWFPNTGELLDWLRATRGHRVMPRSEWWRMQWHWAIGLMRRHLRSRARRLTNGDNHGQRDAQPTS